MHLPPFNHQVEKPNPTAVLITRSDYPSSTTKILFIKNKKSFHTNTKCLWTAWHQFANKKYNGNMCGFEYKICLKLIT